MRTIATKDGPKLNQRAGEPRSRLAVSLFLGDGFDIWLHSYFLTGLIGLAHEGAITLRVMRGSDRRRCLALRNNQLLMLKCVDETRGISRIICFDSQDQSNVWQERALDESDVYFKRSTYPPDTARLSPSQQLKVRPINPIFATWHPAATGWTARMYAAFVRSAFGQIAERQPARNALRSLYVNCRTLAYLSSIDLYEDTPTGGKRHQVLFQTRLWDPAVEEGDWPEPCNLERVELVRTLRKRLGDRCVGGLIRTPYAEKHYPDLLSNLTATAKAKRPEFIRLCRQFLVRVNIKALFDAIPYSLGETLAANNCLVSQSIRNSFATPLLAGQHYLEFTTAEECAERCRELLDSEAKAAQLREAAHAYYKAAVRPQEAMRMYLEQA